VPGQTLEERLANLEAWGYQGIQVQRPTLQMGIPALKAALATGSVRVCTFRGGGGLLLATRRHGRLRWSRSRRDFIERSR
jgi:sugar phosphate isomerase/epimerase